MLGEAGIIHYCNDLNKDYVIVRFHNVYGPRMGFSHVIPQVVKRFLDEKCHSKFMAMIKLDRLISLMTLSKELC